MNSRWLASLLVPFRDGAIILCLAIFSSGCTTVTVRGRLPYPRSAVSVPIARKSELLDALESFMKVQGFKRRYSQPGNATERQDPHDLQCRADQPMLCYSNLVWFPRAKFRGVFIFQPREVEDRFWILLNFLDLGAAEVLDGPDSAVYRGLIQVLRVQFETDLAIHHPFLAPP